jgi:hypothetical protein
MNKKPVRVSNDDPDVLERRWAVLKALRLREEGMTVDALDLIKTAMAVSGVFSDLLTALPDPQARAICEGLLADLQAKRKHKDS